MDVILIWTIWLTAFTGAPEPEALEKMCKRSHPQATLSHSMEVISWSERIYPAAMVTCARPIEPGGPEQAPPQPEPSKITT